MELNDKIQPQSIDIEEAILGALLIDSSGHEIITKIKPEYFYNTANETIFATIKELYEKLKKIDILTVTEKLRKKNKLENVGGPYYITKLTSKVVSSLHIEEHYYIILEKYIRRLLINKSHKIHNQSFDESIELEDILALLEDREIDEILTSNEQTIKFKEVVKESIDSAHKRKAQFVEGITPGIKTPFSKLNEYLAGWQNSDLIFLAGRPSMGKTAMALTIAKKAAKNKSSVNFFSLEMARIKLADRLALSETNINPNHYKTGNLSEMDFKYLDEAEVKIKDYPLYIYDRSTYTVEEIKSICKVNKRKGKCDFVIIDFLQLIINSSKNKRYNKVQEIGDISHKLKALSKELDVPVICLSQLNRELEKRSNKEPLLCDLRESGDIEQDADIVLFIYRSHYYSQLEEDFGSGELIIAKNRNGQTGKIKFAHNEYLNDFYDEYISDKNEPF